MKQVHRLKFPAKLGLGKRAEAEFGKQFGGLRVWVCVCGRGGRGVEGGWDGLGVDAVNALEFGKKPQENLVLFRAILGPF